MKIKIVPIIIAAAICSLIAYGLYSWCKTEGQEILLAIAGFASMFLPLAVCLGVRFEGRVTASTATVGAIFFISLLVSNIIFASIIFAVPTFIVVNGLLLLLFLALVYALAKSKQ